MRPWNTPSVAERHRLLYFNRMAPCWAYGAYVNILTNTHAQNNLLRTTEYSRLVCYLHLHEAKGGRVEMSVSSVFYKADLFFWRWATSVLPSPTLTKKIFSCGLSAYILLCLHVSCYSKSVCCVANFAAQWSNNALMTQKRSRQLKRHKEALLFWCIWTSHEA